MSEDERAKRKALRGLSDAIIHMHSRLIALGGALDEATNTWYVLVENLEEARRYARYCVAITRD